VLRATEVRQDVLEAPARVAELRPSVVVRAVAADVHLDVDGGTPAERLAARHEDRARAALGLRLAPERPVVRRPEQLRPRRRDPDLPRRPRRAGLEQQHRGAGVLAEPRGEDAAGRPAADDHEIVHVAPPGEDARHTDTTLRRQAPRSLTVRPRRAYSSRVPRPRAALLCAVVALGSRAASAVEPADVTVRRSFGAVAIETSAAAVRVRLGHVALRLRDRGGRRVLTAERPAGGLFYERGGAVHALGRATDVAILADGVRLTVATDEG